MAHKKRKAIEQVTKEVRRVSDLGSLPKGVVTVDDVLSVNDINQALAELHEKRAEIEALLVAWVKPNGAVSYRYVKCTDMTLIGICEIVKNHVIDSNWLTPV